MTTSPIILVPGFWLGAWAWDEVAAALRAAGHEVTALTLPGLGSADADRSSITLADHVEAICEAVTAAGSPVVLAVHSGTGFSGYAASDRMPELIAAMVYVDFAPGKGALAPDFDGAEKPMNWEEIAEEENLDGLNEEQLETFRQRAVPEPGGHPARGRSAEQRCAPRYPDHDHLHGLPVRAGQNVRAGARLGMAGGRGRAARHHLGRPADQPLADVVASSGACPAHRQRCRERPTIRPIASVAPANDDLTPETGQRQGRRFRLDPVARRA